MLNKDETKLLKIYKKLWLTNGAPAWAFQIPPAITAIGSKMRKHIISFASCENFKGEYPSELINIYKVRGFDYVVSRSRWPSKESQYFPHRHITPFDCRDQYVITWFALRMLEHDLSDEISEFSEQISTANPFKFTIFHEADETNKDPKKEHVPKSLPYLKADLRVIKPEVIIIPKSRFELFGSKPEWKDMLNEASIKHIVQFVWIEQAGQRRINISQLSTSSIVESECEPINTWIKESRCSAKIKGHLSYLKNKWDNEGWMFSIDPLA